MNADLASNVRPGASRPQPYFCQNGAVALFCQDAADDAIAAERIPNTLGGHMNFHLPIFLDNRPANIGGRLAAARLGERPKLELFRILYLNERGGFSRYFRARITLDAREHLSERNDVPPAKLLSFRYTG